MKRLLSLVLCSFIASFFVVAMPTAAQAKVEPVICPSYAPNGTDKIDTSGDPQFVHVVAPEGFLIGGYCVKGGLVTDIVTLDPPVAELDIFVSNGKAVSHYSVWYVPGGCTYSCS